MKLSDFDFALPEDLIATRPARPRPAARLLVVQAGAQGAPRLQDAHVSDLPAFLRPGDRLVFNDTRVLPARLNGVRRRAGGGDVAVEVTLMRPIPEGRWEVMARPLRRLAPGDRLSFGDDLGAQALGAEVVARSEDRAVIAFDLAGPDFDTALARVGSMPLPPYIASRRPADARDNEDYQTIFATRPGAVAAPTAALHFDATLLAALDRAGVARSTVTLHVGAGTFLPVKVEDIARHHMHSEWGEVTAAAAAEINATRAAGGRVIPVGTTCLRLLESAAAPDGTLRPWRGETDIFIRPGYRFRIADGLMTNFHLPKSTLMMLVSALIGRDAVMVAYAHAVAERYRFFSYGDSSLLLPAPSP